MSCFIIAEIGVNHGGDLKKAFALIDAAAQAGANAVKFQTYNCEEIAVPGSHREMLRRLHLPLCYYGKLMEYAEKRDVEFISSPFDIESAYFLKRIGVKRLKLGSGELTNIPYLQELRNVGLPIIVSTGMSTIDECEKANDILGLQVDTWLHCVSVYPAPMAGYNLKCMDTLHTLTGKPVGLSDHTIGDHLAIAAVAMGATMLEKHITLSFEEQGPDHMMSTEPMEFKNMVANIREIESALGDGIKRPTPEEYKTMPRARRVNTPEGFKRSL